MIAIVCRLIVGRDVFPPFSSIFPRHCFLLLCIDNSMFLRLSLCLSLGRVLSVVVGIFPLTVALFGSFSPKTHLCLTDRF